MPIGGSMSLEIRQETVSELLVDGFFPHCARHDRPQRRAASGFREIGLPYENDTAITRHLAAFLSAHFMTAAFMAADFMAVVFTADSMVAVSMAESEAFMAAFMVDSTVAAFMADSTTSNLLIENKMDDLKT